MRRHLLGITGLAMMLLGLAVGPMTSHGGISLRAGMVLAVLWLALPQLVQVFSRASPWVIATVGLGCLLMIIRPRLAIVVVPILLAMGAMQFASWLLRPPPKHKGKGQGKGKERRS